MAHRTQRFLAAFVILAVALALPAVDPAPSLAAARLSVSPSNPVAREYIKIGGRFGTSVQRPVRLQYRTSSGWKSLSSKTTTSTGKFVFRTRAVAPSRKFRAFAPRFSKNGRKYSAVASDPRTVKTVRARGNLGFVPAKVGQSKAGAKNLTPGVASFNPIRKGRKVLLQRLVSGRWKTVQDGRQNRRGAFAFNVAAKRRQNYRAITVAKNGAPAKKTGKTTVRYLDQKFNDNFKSFNTNKWSLRTPGYRNDTGGRLCSESSRKSVSVRDGKLRLQTKRIPRTDYAAEEWALETDCPNGQFYNGHISTQNKFSFKHGIMAMRVKMQPQRGHHGGLWSQPTTQTSLGAEIDAVEYYGNTYTYQGQIAPIQHSIYYNEAVHPKVVKNRDYLLRRGREWSSDYHVFSVQWTPKKYIFRIDGRETWRTGRGVSQTEQFPILSLLSSDWELPALPKSGPYTPMFVDWVRVWEY